MVLNSTCQKSDQVELRKATQDDLGFLRTLYFTTRYDIARMAVSEEHKLALLNHQFLAQHQHYQTHFADAEFSVICQDGKPIGRLYVNQTKDELRVIDISIVPEFRRKGIGTRLIHELQVRAKSARLPLRLRVEHDNPARELYFRLGFRLLEDENINLHLQWNDLAGE